MEPPRKDTESEFRGNPIEMGQNCQEATKISFLEEAGDWIIYKNYKMFGLQPIGYTKRIKLANLDKMNLEAMIRRYFSDGPRCIIEDLGSGTDMMC